MSEINNTQDLNEVFEEEMDDATVITAPIDTTLTHSGEAADAKAVGDRFAAQGRIRVNEEEADNQGQIYISGEGIPVNSETGAESLAEAVGGLLDQTGADIPLTADEGAETIGEAVAALQGRTGADIPLTGLLGAPKVAEAVEAAQDAASGAVKSVNGIVADENGAVTLNKVPTADNLDSTTRQTSSGDFILRAAGGSASLSDGPASLRRVSGNTVRTGHVDEALNFSVGSEDCDASITDMDLFREAMGESGVLVLTYGSGWSENPAGYGITVVGTPANGDTITADWTKEVRGTITNATPDSFIVTGWNIFSEGNGYARVVRYSDEYGYAISGSYSELAFSQTINGDRSAITPGAGGLFQVPADGYVWVTGGGNNTAIWATWSDWQGGYPGDFQAYSQQAISLAAVMSAVFPDGLCAVGSVRDYIDIAGGFAYSWVQVLEYSAENLAVAEGSGRAYTYDEENIYLARASAVATALTGNLAVSGNYTVNGHGLEIFDGTLIAAGAVTSYSADLKNKLERDVLTISQQTLTSAEKTQVRSNIGALASDSLDGIFRIKKYTKKLTNVESGAIFSITREELNISTPNGYTEIGMVSFNTGSAHITVGRIYPSYGTVVSGKNTASSAKDINFEMQVLYVKSNLM